MQHLSSRTQARLDQARTITTANPGYQAASTNAGSVVTGLRVTQNADSLANRISEVLYGYMNLLGGRGASDLTDGVLADVREALQRLEITQLDLNDAQDDIGALIERLIEAEQLAAKEAINFKSASNSGHAAAVRASDAERMVEQYERELSPRQLRNAQRRLKHQAAKDALTDEQSAETADA